MGTLRNFKKKQRHNPELISEVKSKPCAACGKSSFYELNDAHHVTTRGAGGGDTYDNLMPLDRQHHTELHQIGYKKMCEKYPSVKEWLENNFRDDILKRMLK